MCVCVRVSVCLSVCVCACERAHTCEHVCAWFIQVDEGEVRQVEVKLVNGAVVWEGGIREGFALAGWFSGVSP